MSGSGIFEQIESVGTSRPAIRALIGFMCVLCCQSGCQNSPYPPPPNPYPPASISSQNSAQVAPPPATVQAPTTGPNSVYAQQQTNPQVLDLQQRVRQLDENNRQLTTQVAQLQQQTQAYRERSELLAQQLQAATDQNKQLLASVQPSAQRMPASSNSADWSTNSRGDTRLTANNSLQGSTVSRSSNYSAMPGGVLKIQGAEVVNNDNAIRIRIASDQLFTPGTAQRNPAGDTLLIQVGEALLRRYPRQRIGIEGHTDDTAVGSAYGSPYQLTAAQAQSVMEYLVRRSGVPMQQLFVAAHGPNRPLADNRTAAGRAENRRIEVVIYADSY